MAQVDLKLLIEQLDDNMDDLEEALAPLLKTTLADSASKLPLLDRVKLYVLSTYAIESLIFSFLRLNGVNAKSHPIFTELTRVKQYFEKIKITESKEPQRTMSLDKAAANRFIKHDLAKNNRLDANTSSLHTGKAGVHTRFPAEADAKVLKAGGNVSVPSHTKPKARELHDGVTISSRARSQTEDVATSILEPTHDPSSSSSSIKRPRETDVSTNSSEEPKGKKRKSTKRTRRRRVGQGTRILQKGP